MRYTRQLGQGHRRLHQKGHPHVQYSLIYIYNFVQRRYMTSKRHHNKRDMNTYSIDVYVYFEPCAERKHGKQLAPHLKVNPHIQYRCPKHIPNLNCREKKHGKQLAPHLKVNPRIQYRYPKHIPNFNCREKKHGKQLAPHLKVNPHIQYRCPKHIPNLDCREKKHGKQLAPHKKVIHT